MHLLNEQPRLKGINVGKPVYTYLHALINYLKHLGLLYRPREPVQYPPINPAIILHESLLDYSNHELVRQQVALGHHLLRDGPQFCTQTDLTT